MARDAYFTRYSLRELGRAHTVLYFVQHSYPIPC
jgi:hypothetical protein